ncbi:MAG: hypothetical protein WD810_03185 [Solirubrobacterales bacterium]
MKPAPVAVRVAGDFKVADGDVDQLPQLRQIKVAINRQGRLFDRGLPVCHVKMIQPASQAAARRVCGGAIIGSGHVALQVHIPSQPSFRVKANLLAFNGPRRNGHKLILAQAYARSPPGAFVLTFRVSKRSGTFGTVMSTTLPHSAQDWAFLTHFDMTLHRTYVYRGRRRSYVSAACSAPAGFDSVLFPFARATYGFASAQRLSISVARVCRVRGQRDSAGHRHRAVGAPLSVGPAEFDSVSGRGAHGDPPRAPR